MTRPALHALLASLLILTAPAQVAAQTPIEGFALASEVARAELPAMAALRARGARVVGVINVERLPRGAWMAELEIETPRKQRARLPVKLTREASAWRIVWTPLPEYVEALLSITAGALPRDELGAAAWAQGGRMPALPIIATRQRLITPLGAMPWDAGELPDNMPTSAKELAPPAQLTAHIERWFGDVLEGEPGAASVDLLAEPGLDWRSVQKILLAAGSQGAFVLHAICAREGALVAAPLMAPVFGNVPEPDRPHPLTVTLLEPVGAQMKARVSYRGKVITEQPTLLLDSPQALAALLPPLITAAIPQPGPRHLFFGAPGDTSLQEVLRWLAPLPAAAQVAPSKIFVGYVRKD